MAERTCCIDDCERPHYSKGMCKPCYRRDYYQRNKERENANFRAYRAANLEHEKARFAEYSQRRWGAKREARTEAIAERLASPTKTCTKCGDVKLKEDFHLDPRSRDDRYSWCKACFHAHTTSKRDLAIERQRSRKRYQTDPEYRARRNHQHRISSQKRYASDPEYAEKVRRKVREWAQAHPERASINARNSANRRRARIKSQSVGEVDYAMILDVHGMACYLCGDDIPTMDLLHFDHVIPLARGGLHSTENIKPAHGECNMRKGAKLLSELDWYTS